MTEKWELALEKFISKWKNKKEVVGAIACGSYITGSPSKHSDIDIHIILGKNVKWRERGNEIIDGILIEYFANPLFQLQRYMKKDYKQRRKMDVHMFLTGRVIFDKNGDLKKIIQLAKKMDKKRFEKTGKIPNELAKYGIWDMNDNLEEIYESGGEEFYFTYYNFLDQLLGKYSSFVGFVKIGENKVLRFLASEKDKAKYHIPDFPDKKFVDLFVNAIRLKDKTDMIKEYSALTEYVLNKMGGFNIDGWKIRSPVEKDKK